MQYSDCTPEQFETVIFAGQEIIETDHLLVHLGSTGIIRLKEDYHGTKDGTWAFINTCLLDEPLFNIDENGNIKEAMILSAKQNSDDFPPTFKECAHLLFWKEGERKAMKRETEDQPILECKHSDDQDDDAIISFEVDAVATGYSGPHI
ncbi:MAG: hypothetical protein GY821_15315 [Gammaproteobacteria bacterium]|nr:hypothetical protein [Gammaproteobacteria bacterium]